MSKKIDRKILLNREECSEIIKVCEEIGFTPKNYGNEGEPVYSIMFDDTHDIYCKIKSKLPIFDDFFGEAINNSNFRMTNLSVNKYSQANKTDMPVHNDSMQFSVSTSLNGDYEGGGVYFPFYGKIFNTETQKIGESVIWRADKLLSFHEALPVEGGERYSLIMFFTDLDERKMIPFIFTQLFGLLVVKILPIYKILKYFKLRNR